MGVSPFPFLLTERPPSPAPNGISTAEIRHLFSSTSWHCTCSCFIGSTAIQVMEHCHQFHECARRVLRLWLALGLPFEQSLRTRTSRRNLHRNGGTPGQDSPARSSAHSESRRGHSNPLSIRSSHCLPKLPPRSSSTASPMSPSLFLACVVLKCRSLLALAEPGGKLL